MKISSRTLISIGIFLGIVLATTVVFLQPLAATYFILFLICYGFGFFVAKNFNQELSLFERFKIVLVSEFVFVCLILLFGLLRKVLDRARIVAPDRGRFLSSLPKEYVNWGEWGPIDIKPEFITKVYLIVAVGIGIIILLDFLKTYLFFYLGEKFYFNVTKIIENREQR